MPSLETLKRNLIKEVNEAKLVNQVYLVDSINVFCPLWMQQQLIQTATTNGTVNVQGLEMDAVTVTYLMSQVQSFSQRLSDIAAQKVELINICESEEELSKIDPDSDFPETPSYILSEIEEKAKEASSQSGSQTSAETIAFMQYITENDNDIPSDKAVEFPSAFQYFDYYCDRKDEKGDVKEMEMGIIFRYKRDGEEELWRAKQTHTPLSIYPPSKDTYSIYEKVDISHDGTIEDPIPYSQGLSLEAGKYYEQYGIIYKCIQYSGPQPYDLKEMPSIVTPVK